MEFKQFIADFQDYLAPKLDTYEQAIYLYIFRHSRFLGVEEVVIGFRSARKLIASGSGVSGTPMSDRSCYKKLDSLVAKGYVDRLGTERSGTRLRLRLPEEIPGLIPAHAEAAPIDIEHVDFFNVSENRLLILERKAHRCFYCLHKLDDKNHVIEHVQSRPEGTNCYRNVVAACRQCNNRKNAPSADDWLRTLYRDGFLGTPEFEERLSHLQQLKSGLLKPVMPI